MTGPNFPRQGTNYTVFGLLAMLNLALASTAGYYAGFSGGKGALFKEGSAPSTPASGEIVIYADQADGKIKSKNSAGTVAEMGGGGGGPWEDQGGNEITWTDSNTVTLGANGLTANRYYNLPDMGNHADTLGNTIGVLAPSVSWNGGNRLAGVAVSAPTFSSGSVTSNVATINTTAAHGLTTGDKVTISGSAGVSVNGTYQVTFVDSDTFTFNKTVGNGTITAATITPEPMLQLAGGINTAFAPSVDVLVAPATTSRTALSVMAPSGYSASAKLITIGTNGGTSMWVPSAGSTWAFGNNDYRMEIGNNGVGLSNNAGISWTPSTGYGSSGDLYNLSDTAIPRVAPGITKTSGGSAGAAYGWHQTAGDLLVNADQAVDSATLTNATSLVTVSIATTRKIAFEAYLPFTAGDTVADGVQIDFAQGTATATYFIADAELVDGAGLATLTNPRVSALNTAISVAATTNTNFTIKIRGALVVNGAGTFGLRFAKVADAGTGLTLKRGSWIKLWDMP
ncbi:MAG: hypothetical protein KIS92_00910 [Planctomycetota bacterium]|nr:hypothetical protein [Planctomycetota bacterium]